MKNEKLFQVMDDNGAEVEDSLDRLCGDEDLYLEFLKDFENNESVVELRKAVIKKDAKAASDAVHTLKGVALNLGLLPLADVCMDMLLDFRSSDIDSAFSQLDAVEECFRFWCDLIDKNVV